MRNIYLWLLLAIMTGCSPGEYIIHGTVDGRTDGNVSVVFAAKNRVDTLARAGIRDGRFEIRGNCRGVIPARIQVDGINLGGASIYLENNKTYHARLIPNDMQNSEITGGGESQRLLNDYLAIDRACRNAVNQIRDEYSVALRDPENPRSRQIRQYVDSLQNAAREEQSAFLKEHATSYLALNHYALDALRIPLDELKSGFARFDPEMQKSYAGEVIVAQINKLESLMPGQIVPDFTISDIEGKPFTLHSVKGKLKLVDFWASWCGPCRALTPELIELYNNYHDKDLEIIGVSFDSDMGKWLKAIEEERMPWIHGSDLKGFTSSPLTDLYAILGIPHLVILDEDNRIIATNIRGEELIEVISERLDK